MLIHEFQAQDDPGKAVVIQLETLIFLCYARDTERGGGTFRPLPVFVHLKGESPNNAVSVRTPSGRGFTGEPVEWTVAADSALETLDKVKSGEFSWGALFWIALMLGAEDEVKVVEPWLSLVEEKVPPRSKPDVRHIALVFAELAGRRPVWSRVVKGVDMTESAVVNEIIELGEMRQRKDLAGIIRLRFPALLTPDMERAIADQPNLALMQTWLDAALDPATTAESFLAVLRR